MLTPPNAQTDTQIATARPRVVLFPGSREDDRIDLSDQVLAFRCSSTCTSPDGSFEVRIVARQGDLAWIGRIEGAPDLLTVARMNAVVVIGYDEPGGITMGLITSISESATFFGPGVAREYMIRGSTMGKLITNDTMVDALLTSQNATTFRNQINAVLGPQNGLDAFFERISGPSGYGFLNATVQDVVEWAIDNIPTMRIPLMGSVYGDPRPGVWVRTIGTVTSWNDSRVFSSSLTMYNGNFYGFIAAAVDLDFYEIFMDTRPARDGLGVDGIPDVELIVRPKPFDHPPAEVLPVTEETGLRWQDLRTRYEDRDNHVIELDDVLSFELGATSDDAYTWYMVTNDAEVIGNSAAVAAGLAFPAVDLYLVQTLGVRPYNVRLNLIGGDIKRLNDADRSYVDEVVGQTIEFRNRLVNWCRYNPWMARGTVTVRGRDEYRPGEPVYLPWYEPTIGGEIGARFYCTAVSWSWSIGGRYECSLTVERGQNDTMLRAVRDLIARSAAQFPGVPISMFATG
jgi:hypothetical protein